MCNPLKDMQLRDFTEPNNKLQLADDSLLMSEYESSLILLFKKIFNYAEQKYISINMDKTKYMHMCKNPTLHELKFDNRSISAVDPEIGYKWLGFNLSYSSSVHTLIQFNFKKKKIDISKFYAWLQINESTPFPLKLKILYCCMLPSLLYSSEAWGPLHDLEEQILLIERKALKACLGVKSGTSDEIIYTELNKSDIVAHIYMRLKQTECTAKNIWQSYKQAGNYTQKPFLAHYKNLTSDTITKNIEDRKDTIRQSTKTMHKRYLDLFNLEYSGTLYNSMINDKDRMIISRWGFPPIVYSLRLVDIRTPKLM